MADLTLFGGIAVIWLLAKNQWWPAAVAFVALAAAVAVISAVSRG